MGYRLKPKIKIDLSELGDNNGEPFFAEIKNPRMLTFEEKAAFGEVALIEEAKKRAAAMVEVARELVIAWNLLDMESELPVSLIEPECFKHVPSLVLEAIFVEIGKKDESIKNS